MLRFSITLALVFVSVTTSYAQGFNSTTNSTSILLHGGTILSYNNQTEAIEVIRNGSLLITNSRINSITSFIPSNLPSGTEIVDVTNKIISPGFVDTHRHLWQTAYRTIASNTTLGEYFLRYGESSQANTVFTPEDIYIGQLFGVYESLNAGVTSIVDHAHGTFSPDHAEASFQASIDSEARIWWGYGIHDLGPDHYSEDEQIADWQRLAKSPLNNGLAQVSLAWDGLTTTFTPSAINLTQTVYRISAELNVPVITSHYVSNPWVGNEVVQKLSDLSLLNTSIPLIFSHASGLTQSEAFLLRETNQHISITAESESHYGHLHPRSHLIQDQASLGIDTHFTFSADILTQSRLWLQETRYLLFKEFDETWAGMAANNPMSAQQAFFLATRNGGLALNRTDIGVLTEGAVADVTIFDTDAPNLLGFRDPIAAVILHANVGDVESVIVNGKFVKRDGKLVVTRSKAYEGLKTRFLNSAKRIQDIWANTTFPETVGTSFNPEFQWAELRRVDAQRGPGNGY